MSTYIVEAVQEGVYKGVYQAVGNVFQLASNGDLCSSAVDQFAGTSDSPWYGWMAVQTGNPTPGTSLLPVGSLIKNHVRRNCF